MKSFLNLFDYPSSTMLAADDVVEFHAARLLLLLKSCGNKKGELDGLTKLAKLDFFVRYPEFFHQVVGDSTEIAKNYKRVESPMIRHFYGPWDKRYYHVLAYLEARGLIVISKPSQKIFRFSLTDAGKFAAEELSSDISFSELIMHMQAVSVALGKQKGNALKDMIYQAFQDEVALKQLGEVI